MDATLYRHDVRLAHAVQGGAQRHEGRSRLYLVLRDADGVGVGEVAPQPVSLNGDPGLESVVDELRDVVLPQLRAIRSREGALPSWTRVSRFHAPREASASALALVEMALLHRELVLQGRRLDELWPSQSTLRLQRSVSLVDESSWPSLSGVARVRAKVSPGVVSSKALERLADVSLPVMLDFNATASDAQDVLGVVEQVQSVAHVVAVEQPFLVGNLVDSARLGEDLDMMVSLDESVRSLRDVEQIARYGAAALVCVKPARVGGLANARTVIARARELGLGVYVGGFFESPYARAVNRVLAEHGVIEPSDVGDVEVAGEDLKVFTTASGFGLEVNEDFLRTRATRIFTTGAET